MLKRFWLEGRGKGSAPLTGEILVTMDKTAVENIIMTSTNMS